MSARARPYQRLPQSEGSMAPHSAGSAQLSAQLESMDIDRESDDDDDGGGSSSDESGRRRSRSTGEDDDDDDAAAKSRARSQRAAAWSNKMHAFLWVVAAGSVAYALDFFHVIFHDPRVRQYVLQAPVL
ncbi:hypothetical protein PINS_up009514 [Pythium insidiosum]|nr:hypothetical protein PINS_up009514 [Pythium insidiosum]